MRTGMIKRDKTMILEMTGIIGFFGVLVAVFEIVFAKRVMYSLLGLLIGCILAVYMLWYMELILRRGMDFDAKTIQKYVVKHSIIRYISLVVVFALVCITEIADPIACFIGLLGLKASAYLQPVVHKLIKTKTEKKVS